MQPCSMLHLFYVILLNQFAKVFCHTLFSFLGSGIRRSDDQVFLVEGDIQMNRDDVENMVQNDGKSRQIRAAIINNGRNLWSPNIPYAIASSLCTF